MISALPFRLISDGTKRQASEAFLHLCREWGAKWFLEKPIFQVNVTSNPNTLSISTDQWMVLGSAPDLWVAWKLDGATTREWLGMIFGSPIGVSIKSTPLMQDMLLECVTSLVQELAIAIEEPNLTRQESDVFIKQNLRTGYGSGSVVVELQGGGQRQVIALGGGVVERWIKLPDVRQSQAQSLDSMQSAVGNLTTKLEVMAGHAELTLKDIVHLEVGDVIQVDTKLGEAFEIRAEGLRVATAKLGVRGDQKAIQFIE